MPVFVRLVVAALVPVSVSFFVGVFVIVIVKDFVSVCASACILVTYYFCCSLYDVDGNGWIDIDEMTKIVRSIYKMMGPTQVDCAEKKAEEVFNQMDANKDGRLTRQEFVCSCMNDSKLANLLSPR